MYFDPMELDEIFHYYAGSSDMDALEDVLKLAETLHPTELVTISLQAEYALMDDRPEECMTLLESVFMEDNLLHLMLRSGALARLGRVTEAISWAERAMEFDDPMVAYDLGVGFLNAGQYSIAIRYYRRCLEAVPDDLRAMLGLLFCLNRVGKAEEVLQCADRALEVDSFCLEAWLAKSGIYMDKEQWKEAEECCDYAMAINPENADSMVMKAQCCLHTERIDEAYQYGQEAAEHADYEQRANIYLFLARLDHERDRTEQAVEWGWKALMTSPDDWELVERVAFFFADAKEAEIASALLADLIRAEGEDATAYQLSVLADQYTQLGRVEDAIAVFERLTREFPTAASYTMMGGAFMGMGRFRKAYSALQHACKLEYIWQTNVLLTLCAHELGWHKAMMDHFTVAYCVDADEACKLLHAIGPQVMEELEKRGIYEYANTWCNNNMRDQVQKGRRQNEDSKNKFI